VAFDPTHEISSRIRLNPTRPYITPTSGSTQSMFISELNSCNCNIVKFVQIPKDLKHPSDVSSDLAMSANCSVLSCPGIRFVSSTLSAYMTSTLHSYSVYPYVSCIFTFYKQQQSDCKIRMCTQGCVCLH